MIIYSNVHSGLSINSSQLVLQQRTQELLDNEIEFVSHRSFNDPDLEFEIRQSPFLTPIPGQVDGVDDSQRIRSSTDVARFCEAEILTAEAEQDLFRRMNYLKFRANALRSQLDPELPDEDKINIIDTLLKEAESVRNYIFRCNMRLVVSIVKKCVSPYIAFEDLLSDGTWTLMKAVDKFDYGRGFRFSTYAYRAITNHAYRRIANRRKEAVRFSQSSHDRVLEETKEEKRPFMGEKPWQELSDLLSRTIKKLDQREQIIVRGRFALGNDHKTKTFQRLADELGISKERVRQLEKRAVAKLRVMAEKTNLDLLREFADV